MPPLESAVVKKILIQLRLRGGFWFKIHGSPFVLTGLPDIVGCYMGRFVSFEVKRAAGIPAKPIQVYMMGRIKAAGGVSELIYTANQALQILQEIETSIKPIC